MSKIGVLIIGSKGSVATTLLAARCASLSSGDFKFPLPSEMEPAFQTLELLELKEMVIGGWDIVSDSYSQSARIHGVVPVELIDRYAPMLDRTDVYPAILVGRDQSIESICGSDQAQARMQDVRFATTVFTQRPHLELVKSVEYDITDFRQKHEVSKVIVVNLASTGRGVTLSKTHESLEAFERGLAEDAPSITASMLYAYAAITNGASVINFTPTAMLELPALQALARREGVALAGKDGKTGQTLYKSVVAAMLKHRALRLKGWYSTNILGNRDGQVLDDPEHRATKIASKSGVLEKILGYSDYDHQVHIHYYKPRGDSKEAWDTVDFEGWFGVPMQMKIDWLGDDSILAAPLVVDLIRWVNWFTDQGACGALPQLASYFKDPMGTDEYDFFKQLEMLKRYAQKRQRATTTV